MSEQPKSRNEQLREVYKSASRVLEPHDGEARFHTPRARNAIARDLATAGLGMLVLEAVVVDDTVTKPAVSFFGRRRDESGHWSSAEELRIYEDGEVTKKLVNDDATPAMPEDLSSREIKAFTMAVVAIERYLN